MIRQLGPRRFRLYSKNGRRNLGTYRSLEGALRRERQVEYFKREGKMSKRKRRRLPPRRKDGRFRRRK